MRSFLPTKISPTYRPAADPGDVLAVILERTEQLLERLAKLESALISATDQRKAQDWYSTSAAAKVLGKAEFTVREWCRLRRVHAKKRSCGRGLSREWMLSHAELERIRSEGLLPAE